jgi:hypothetical protein
MKQLMVRVEVTADFAIGFVLASEGFSRVFAGKSRVLARVSGLNWGVSRRGGFGGFVCRFGAADDEEATLLESSRGSLGLFGNAH